jgi:hypothetical protein
LGTAALAPTLEAAFGTLLETAFETVLEATFGAGLGAILDALMGADLRVGVDIALPEDFGVAFARGVALAVDLAEDFAEAACLPGAAATRSPAARLSTRPAAGETDVPAGLVTGFTAGPAAFLVRFCDIPTPSVRQREAGLRGQLASHPIIERASYTNVKTNATELDIRPVVG